MQRVVAGTATAEDLDRLQSALRSFAHAHTSDSTKADAAVDAVSEALDGYRSSVISPTAPDSQQVSAMPDVVGALRGLPGLADTSDSTEIGKAVWGSKVRVGNGYGAKLVGRFEAGKANNLDVDSMRRRASEFEEAHRDPSDPDATRPALDTVNQVLDDYSNWRNDLYRNRATTPQQDQAIAKLTDALGDLPGIKNDNPNPIKIGRALGGREGIQRMRRVTAGTADNIDMNHLKSDAGSLVKADARAGASTPEDVESTTDARITALDKVNKASEAYRDLRNNPDPTVNTRPIIRPDQEQAHVTATLINALHDLPGIQTHDPKEMGREIFNRTKYAGPKTVIDGLNALTKGMNLLHNGEYFSNAKDMSEWDAAWHVFSTVQGGVLDWIEKTGYLLDNASYFTALHMDVYDSAKGLVKSIDRSISAVSPSWAKSTQSTRANLGKFYEKSSVQKLGYWNHLIGAVSWVPGDIGWTASELTDTLQSPFDAWSAVYCFVGVNYWLPKKGDQPTADKPYSSVFGLIASDWGKTITPAGVPLAGETGVEGAFSVPIAITDGVTGDNRRMYGKVGDILLPLGHAVGESFLLPLGHAVGEFFRRL